MAGRPGLDPTEEGKSYSALFVLMVAVLLVSAVWSIWDDNISRRPWKQYQVQWDHLAYDKYMKDAADEQKRLDADPEYQKVSKELAEARNELDSGATAAKLAALRAQLTDLNNTANDKDQLVRFTKSYLTERWYDYNHAVQEKEDPAPYKKEIDQLNAELAQENIVSDKAKDDLQAVKDQIEALNSKVDSLTDQMKKLTAKRDDSLDKADTWMIPVKFRNTVLFRYPKIPKIEQTAIDDFDRNAFDEAIARVDRCQSCHMGADKKGFENAPEPFRTHSNFDQIILKHPPDKLGCTPCHDGQGPAVSSVRAGAWRRSGLGFADAQGRQDAVPMHQVPYRRGLAARCGRQTDRGELGRGGADVPADGMRGMPSGGGLRGHAENRPVPETRVGKARPVVDGAMDHKSG